MAKTLSFPINTAFCGKTKENFLYYIWLINMNIYIESNWVAELKRILGLSGPISLVWMWSIYNLRDKMNFQKKNSRLITESSLDPGSPTSQVRTFLILQDMWTHEEKTYSDLWLLGSQWQTLERQARLRLHATVKTCLTHLISLNSYSVSAFYCLFLFINYLSWMFQITPRSWGYKGK